MFAKVLIANRGEIACRVIRTARRLGIMTVAVYSEADRGALHAELADEAWPIGPAPAAESYLNIERILEAVRNSGAEAVHPGYGFLSENAEFAAACETAGIVFVGPPAAAIRAMGSKAQAKALMQCHGVPLVPGYHGEDQDPKRLTGETEKIGFPVLIKASAGGGGRGMRVVGGAAEFAAALKSAKREAKAAFGDGRILIEKYLKRPRHIEIQVFADRHGNTVHLFERDCSIQRRHQKVIEEAPAPGLDAKQRRVMGEAAVAVARAVGYVGAGTVEFIAEAGAFYFIEMNTRLQVEHPVTEAVTGLDLVREQILIAQGERLSVRQDDLTLRGHAIEVRLYAEDPANGFLPTGGRLLDWRPPGDAEIRVESGVEAGSEIALAFDPMLAKLISHAPTRREAALRLARALERLVAPGVVTNRDFLVHVLRHPAFLDGDTTTDFIERHRPALRREVEADRLRGALVAAALAGQAARRDRALVLRTIPSGWRNNPSGFQETRYVASDREVVVGYRPQRRGTFACTLDGAPAEARVLTAAPPEIDLEIDGVRRAFRVTPGSAGAIFVQDADGEVRLQELPRFPEPETVEVTGGYTAPMPAKVVEVRVSPGEAVRRGQLLLTIEAMKMELQITASTDGVVAEVRVAPRQQVDAGHVLVVVEPRAESGAPPSDAAMPDPPVDLTGSAR